MTKMRWQIALSIFLLFNSANAFWFLKPTEEECTSTIRLYDQIFLGHNVFACCKFPTLCNKYLINGSGNNAKSARQDAESKVNVICRFLSSCVIINNPK
ncbi:unnamed protein product [Rodentolepis nana]|uniref:Uncharacterized protein n=1 Tax=Rodentolepis nana TaxID=102285 RepID=A0A0R3T5K8_RODNA|nr:unnamed protein product [Rodentolepis nana]